jgi:hypothetical protein
LFKESIYLFFPVIVPAHEFGPTKVREIISSKRPSPIGKVSLRLNVLIF